MKRCPKCNKVFEDERRFCTHDGGELVADEFALPSEFEDEDAEEQTVIRMNPPVQIPAQSPEPTLQPEISSYSRMDSQIPVPPAGKRKGGCLKYSIILMIGLLIGGGIVLVAMGAGYWYLYEKARVERLERKDRTPSPPPSRRPPEIPGKIRHGAKNPEADPDELNGRVIASRAVVRRSASKSSKRVDVIPRGDRLNIKRRKSKTSPWYQVECEHGVRGWMHGNTIAFR